MDPCLVQKDANNQWAGENLLANLQALQVRSSSEPISANIDKFYYISYSDNPELNNLVCEIFEDNNGSWTGGWPMNINQKFSNTIDLMVAPNQDLVTNGWSIYYTGNKFQNINEHYWDNNGGCWRNHIITPSYMPQTRTDVQIVMNNFNLYYIGTDGYVCHLYYNGIWEGTMLVNWFTIEDDHKIAPPHWNIKNREWFKPARYYSNLIVWDNPIFEEGTDNTFLSHHVYYITSDNKIGCCIYDISNFDTCGVFAGDYCTRCREKNNGPYPTFVKTWYYKTLFPRETDPPSSISPSSILSAGTDPMNNKTTGYFISDGVNPDCYNLWCFDRKTKNPVGKSDLHLAFRDEFDNSNTIYGSENEKKWNPQCPTTNGWWWAYFYTFDPQYMTLGYKFSQNPVDPEDRYLSLIARRIPPNTKFPTWSWLWATSFPEDNKCGISQYSMTSGALQSNWLNCKNPWDCDNQGDTSIFCNPPVVQNTRYTYKYGFNELRCRTPRGKSVWPTCWSMPATDLYFYSLNLFEISGNGRIWFASNARYPASEGPSDAFACYPIGFRYYDDFYTYATDWSRDNLKFYFDNEFIGSFNSNDIASEGFIAHEQGLFKTTDGGQTWENKAQLMPNMDYIYLKFFNHKDGAAVCRNSSTSHFMRTTDGGEHWEGSSLYWFINKVNSMCYHTKDHAIIVGSNGQIFESWNGGLNYVQTPMTIDPPTTLSLNSISFSYQGYIAGDSGLILKHLDYKDNANPPNIHQKWIVSKPQDNPPSTNHLYSVLETNYFIAYAAGANGKIYKTSDGGVTWISQTSGVTNTLKFIYFLDDYVGYIVGDGGCVLKTFNGGISWNASNIQGNPDLTSVEFVSYTKGYITASNGKYYITNDGGINWEGSTLDLGTPLMAMSFPYPHSIPNTNMYFLIHNEQIGGTALCEKPLTVASLDLDYIRVYTQDEGQVQNEDAISQKSILTHGSPTFKQLTKVYPNPSKDVFNITLDSLASNIKVTVQNLAGDLIFETFYLKGVSLLINLGDKPSGIYFVKIVYNDHCEVLKLMKN